MKISKIALAVSAAVLAVCYPAAAHEADGKAARLGKVHFPVSCNEAAQREFNLAMAYYHSFAWEEYKAPLERAIKADPACGMVHWLRALAMLDNPFGWPVNLSPKIMESGLAALEEARKAGLKTDRERAYVDALEAMYKDHDKLNHRTRSLAFEQALEKVAQAYGAQDKEAIILHALFLSATYDPADKKYSRQLRAAQTLEPIYLANPEHPGVAHYLIHSYDYPPIAQQGLDAARRYSKIAPDAAHALHMPSHIFTRVGAWKDSIESNRASANSAPPGSPNYVHAYDYMVYAHLQLGQEKAAAKVFETALTAPKQVDNFAVAFGLASMPARLALERLDWGAAAQTPLPGGLPWEKYPHAEAQNAYARGIGAAMTGDTAGARREAERLQKLGASAAEKKFGYWVEQVAIQSDVLGGLATCSEGKKAQCVEMLRKAADREDASEKHQVTPGPLVPARELLARVLYEQGDARGALTEFESLLQREPNRYHAVAGAAQSAEKAGDRQKAAAYYKVVAQLGAEADSERAAIRRAQSYVSR